MCTDCSFSSSGPINSHQTKLSEPSYCERRRWRDTSTRINKTVFLISCCDNIAGPCLCIVGVTEIGDLKCQKCTCLITAYWIRNVQSIRAESATHKRTHLARDWTTDGISRNRRYSSIPLRKIHLNLSFVHRTKSIFRCEWYPNCDSALSNDIRRWSNRGGCQFVRSKPSNNWR